MFSVLRSSALDRPERAESGVRVVRAPSEAASLRRVELGLVAQPGTAAMRGACSAPATGPTRIRTLHASCLVRDGSAPTLGLSSYVVLVELGSIAADGISLLTPDILSMLLTSLTSEIQPDILNHALASICAGAHTGAWVSLTLGFSRDL